MESMKTLEHRLAWLAGIIDGEGCMYAALASESRVRRDGTRGKYMRVAVVITNTDLAMIEEVISIGAVLGVRFNLEKPKVYRPQHKQRWAARVAGARQATVLLNAVLPFLVTKRERARIVIRLFGYRQQVSYPCNKVSPKRVEGDAWLEAQLAGLSIANKRGVGDAR